MSSIKYSILIFVTVFTFFSCKKADFVKTESTGETIKEFSLITPAANTTFILNAALPDQKVVLRWSAAKPGVDAPVLYRWIAVSKNAENFDAANRLIELLSDKNGSDTVLTLSNKQIDDALKAKGISNGQVADLKWTIEADNGTTKTLSNNIFNISIKRMSDGATPFSILGPLNGNTAIINPTSTTDSLKFNWTRSNAAAGSPAIQYKVSFYETLNSTTPIFSTLSNRAGVDTFKAISYKDITDSLVKNSIPGKSTLYWDITAISGSWQQRSDFTNEVSISRLISYNFPFALNVAGNYQGWSPATAPQLVSMTNNGEYDGYIFFDNTSPEFKIVKGNDWSAGDYGGAAGILTNGGSNIQLTGGAGHYRMFVNTNTMTYQSTKINTWGVIGNATPGGWGTDTDMTYNATTGTWSVTLALTAGELKFRANDDWAINFGDDGNNGTLEYGGANIPISAAGNYTVTLDLNYGGNWSYIIKKN